MRPAVSSSAGAYRPRLETRARRIRGVDEEIRGLPAREAVARTFSAARIRFSCSSSENWERCRTASSASCSPTFSTLFFFLRAMGSYTTVADLNRDYTARVRPRYTRAACCATTRRARSRRGKLRILQFAWMGRSSAPPLRGRRLLAARGEAIGGIA
jgi:hypothetical protein